MKVVLELQDQPSNIKRVTVRHDIVIGRGAECNLRLSSPQVSRRHCFLRISNDAVTVTDLDSSNGTFMNGKRLPSGKRFPLADGTQLAVGPIGFVARVVSEAPAADLLEVNVNDDRIEAEAVANGQPADSTVVATPPASDSDMNFALESAGPSAEDDEPTTDYSASDDLGSGSYFADSDHSIVSEDDPATVSVGDDGAVDEVEVVVDEVEVVEEGDDETLAVDESGAAIVDAELISVNDAEPVVELSEDDLVVDVVDLDDEVLELSDEELLAEDEPAQSSVAEAEDTRKGAAAGSVPAATDEEEEELRNFLQGLD